VTGASGFIGQHLVAHLRRKGQDVRPLSRSTGFDLMQHELPLDGVDLVYHVAARTFVPSAWEDPVGFHYVNAHGTVRVLEQCRRRGVAVVYVSAYVYGEPSSLPIKETAPTQVNNPYSFSKLMGEEACQFFARTFGMQVAIFRLFNVYGPGQDENFLIPSIIKQVRDPAADAVVVADLSPRRDYIHINDVVEAIARGSELLGRGTFNVGSGQSVSVEEIVRTVLKISGSTKTFHDKGLHRKNEISDVVADNTALTEACSWRPSISLEDGLRTVWEAHVS
jgi:nucleoside-diphosphate-sugar epimerase